jgi:glucose-1-phosphate cytidylyltransferase
MKVAILAGGVGSRLSEETEIKPKPMVEIGGRPILWHIMMHYYSYGFKDFVIALGYKGEYIKKYFAEYASYAGSMKINLRSGERTMFDHEVPDWNVELIDTGQATLTGGRIKRLQPYIGNNPFMLTWGDGVSDVNLNNLQKFHKAHGKIATVTTVRPTARFGHIEFDGDRIERFTEKPQTAEGWINGAFFMLQPEVFNYIEGDTTQFEHAPMEGLAKDKQLMAYKHTGFWQCMDTLREKKLLQDMWDSGKPAWKNWK